MNINIKLTSGVLQNLLPSFATDGAAGIDLRSCLTASVTLAPGSSVLCPAGFCIEIPRGYFGMIVPRSSTGSKGLHLKNNVGIIDSDYRGEVMMNLRNVGDDFIKIEPLERVAQMLILPCMVADFTVVEELSLTVRGDGGFGSSGSK